MPGYLLLGQTCVRCIFCRLEAMMISALNSFTGNRFPNQIFKSRNTVNEWRHDGCVDIRPGILEEEKGKTPQHIKPTRKGWLFYCRCIYCRRICHRIANAPRRKYPWGADFSVALSGQMQTQSPVPFQRESAVPRIASVPVVPVRCGR